MRLYIDIYYQWSQNVPNICYHPQEFPYFCDVFWDFHKHLQGLALYPQIVSKDLKNNLNVSNCQPQIDKSCYE